MESIWINRWLDIGSFGVAKSESRRTVGDAPEGDEPVCTSAIERYGSRKYICAFGTPLGLEVVVMLVAMGELG